MYSIISLINMGELYSLDSLLIEAEVGSGK